MSDFDSEIETDFTKIYYYWIIRGNQIITFPDRENPKNVKKKLWNGNLLVEVKTKKKKKHAENLLKMDKFHIIKCRAWKIKLHKRCFKKPLTFVSNTRRNWKAIKKNGVKEYKRISIWRNNDVIANHTYILTFEKPIIPKEIRISYTIERVKQFIPAPLQCFKCQKFGHHKDRGCQVCGKCGERDPNHTEWMQ